MPFVLIAEDNHDICEMMSLFLRTEGFETECASNGVEALQRMRERRPCVVLLDIHMPRMDGFEFRRRQLADPDLAAVPVVCLTALHDPTEIATELALPCLQKPIHLPHLAARVRAVCRSR
jgi:two-component system, chemotaxis family, chemotaxis protein CheY